MKNRDEFKYIVDGANVAYHHQNFTEGKFSYRQIEVLVEKLESRGDGKVLVILPYTYATKNNSCREFYSSVKFGKSRLTVTESDQVRRYANLYCAMLSCPVQCCAVPCCSVLDVLFCDVMCCSVMCCSVL